MSPFPVEAIDEVIWRIDEAIGGPASKGFTTRGWIKKATGAEVVKFLSGIKDRLAHARFTLVDEAHQGWLREDNEPVQVVLRPAKPVERSEGSQEPPVFKVGERVDWTDPVTGEKTGLWTVLDVPEIPAEGPSGDEVYTISDVVGLSEVKAHARELSYPEGRPL